MFVRIYILDCLVLRIGQYNFGRSSISYKFYWYEYFGVKIYIHNSRSVYIRKRTKS